METCKECNRRVEPGVEFCSVRCRVNAWNRSVNAESQVNIAVALATQQAVEEQKAAAEDRADLGSPDLSVVPVETDEAGHRICYGCGDGFIVDPYNPRRQRYCSSACRQRARRRHIREQLLEKQNKAETTTELEGK